MYFPRRGRVLNKVIRTFGWDDLQHLNITTDNLAILRGIAESWK